VKIKAAVLHGENESLRIETVDLAEPKEGELLVKIAAAELPHRRNAAPVPGLHTDCSGP
jgi:Zn-dependent alcohol dehydrogenase